MIFSDVGSGSGNQLEYGIIYTLTVRNKEIEIRLENFEQKAMTEPNIEIY
jgi:hypothetical protein